jgi:hypothetical protein
LFLVTALLTLTAAAAAIRGYGARQDAELQAG